MVLIFFAGCIKLRFKRERSASRPLTVFGNSSSVQLVGTFPGETCSTSTTYYITDEINRRWVEFHNTPTFSVRRKNTNRNEKGYNHFLEVGINTQVDYHYWKTTEHLLKRKIVYHVKCVKCPKITLKSMSTTLYSEYFQKKMIILIYPT